MDLNKEQALSLNKVLKHYETSEAVQECMGDVGEAEAEDRLKDIVYEWLKGHDDFKNKNRAELTEIAEAITDEHIGWTACVSYE